MKVESYYAFILTMTLAACGGINGLGPSTPRSGAPLAAERSSAAGSALQSANGGPNLYVVNFGSSTVTVYATG